MIKVLIADDHNLVRAGIRMLLEQHSDIEVVAEAADGQAAIQLVQEHQPQVVVIDLSMPRMDGAQAAEYILALKPPPVVIVLSMHDDPVLAQKLIRAGVKGYLLKNSMAEELPLAVQSAARGEMFLSPSMADSVVHNMLNGDAEAVERLGDRLTPREREVLQLVAEGHTNNSIANELTISLKTVEKHRANLMEKLEVRDLAHLMRVAIKQGLILDE
jgi:DNA-binding NarL/FixJ family response regulator